MTEVWDFLGTCGVVCIFIENFAEVSQPLVQLMQKDVEFVWGEEHVIVLHVTNFLTNHKRTVTRYIIYSILK